MQQSLGQAGLALLTAVGESPGQIHPGGVVITKDSSNEGRKSLHLWRHHQDVSGFELGVSGQQLQDLIANHLQLAHASRAGVELQRTVLIPGGHGTDISAGREVVLQLFEQGCGPACVDCCSAREKKQVLVLHGS